MYNLNQRLFVGSNGQLEKGHGTMFLYMTAAARLLHAQKWKSPILPTIQEWVMKMTTLAQIAKLTAGEKTLSAFRASWKPFIDFLYEMERNELIF